MNFQPLDEILFQGKILYPPVLSEIIYMRTSTWWTHCATVYDKDTIVEAEAKGVIKSPIDSHAGRVRLVRRLKQTLTIEQIEKGQNGLDNIIKTSEGYDLLALLGFISGIKSFQNSNKWYCSEIMVYLLASLGIDMYDVIPAFIYPCAYEQSNLFYTVEV